jgi:hypothetical protein
MSEDSSNGYEGVASMYVAGRGTRPLVGDAMTLRADAKRHRRRHRPGVGTRLSPGCDSPRPRLRPRRAEHADPAGGRPRDLRGRCIIGDGRRIP